MDIQGALSQRERVEQFRQRHRLGLLTLLFTDIIGSTKIKQDLGDFRAVELIQAHHQKVRETLARFPEGEEIETAGDSFFIVFTKPSDAVRFSLLLQSQLRQFAQANGHALYDRIGIHVGEVFIEENAGEIHDLYGIQVDTCARIMSLGHADQILMSRFAFDNARQVLKGQELGGLAQLSWLNHGCYSIKGVNEPFEICEVGEQGEAVLAPPKDSDKAKRYDSLDSEPVLGWRPAIGQVVPNTSWTLERKLGEGGFGEVWLGFNKLLNERRVFKFCFRADRVRSLKREVTIFKLLKERVGEHPNIVGIRDVFFEEPPYYLIMDYADGVDLHAWFESQGGPEKVPLSTRLEIIAQVADGLQAAHESGIIHRDIKPSNILVKATPSASDTSNTTKQTLRSSSEARVAVKLTDFGVGQVVSLEVLSKMTQLGFSQTLVGSDSGSQPGTQLYMAPELFTGARASIRSDIYSLGVVLYQLLVGDFSRPLTTDWARAIGDSLLEEDLKLCFAGKPEERLDSATQLATRLRGLHERRRQLAEEQARTAAKEKAAYRRGLWRAGLALGTVVVAVAILAFYALAKRKSADKARAEAVESLNLLQIKAAEADLENHDHSSGLARLAAVLRMDPSNRVAAARIMSVLLQRDLPLLLGPPIKWGDGGQGYASAMFSPDGKTVVLGRSDGIARVWNAQTGQPVTQLLKHEAAVHSALFSPDGSHVVTASADKTARVWNAQTGQPVTQPLKHEAEIFSATFSPDGLRVVTASMDKTARVWEAQTGFPVTDLLRHENVVSSATFSPDGLQVLTTSSGNTVRAWDAHTGQPMTTQPLHLDPTGSAELSPDGIQAAEVSGESVRMWDARTGQVITRPFDHKARVSQAHFSVDGQRVLTTTYNEEAWIWAATTGQALTEPLKHERNFWLMWAQFSADGQRVVTVSGDNTARVWDTRVGGVLTAPLKHDAALNSAWFSSDGHRVVTASRDNTARVWDRLTSQAVTKPLKHAKNVWSAEFSPSGAQVVTASEDKTARIWDARTGIAATEPLEHEATVSSAKFSPGGDRVVTASEDKTARVWDARTGIAVTEPLKHEATVSSAKFSPGGDRVVTASEDKAARVWDAQTGTIVLKPLRHEGALYTASFSPDGLSIVTASAGKLIVAVHLWDARNGQALKGLITQGADVMSAEFSPEGRRVVTASYDNTAIVWDVRSGHALTDPVRHAGGVVNATFSPDGHLIVTASDDNTARVWDALTGQAITDPLRHAGQVCSAQFSPDGQYIVTASHDKTARVWEFPFFRAPIPFVLADLAEAVAGKRYDPTRRIIEPLDDDSAFLKIKEKIGSSTDTNAFMVAARWFLADRSTRTISPYSKVTIPEYIETLIRSGTTNDLREALRLSPTNSVALAALAMQCLVHAKGTNTNLLREAELCCFAARKWAPDSEEVLAAHAALYANIGVSSDRLDLVQKAAKRFPQNPTIWGGLGKLLSATNQWQDAIYAYTRFLELYSPESTSTLLFGTSAYNLRSQAYFALGNTNAALMDLLWSKGRKMSFMEQHWYDERAKNRIGFFAKHTPTGRNNWFEYAAGGAEYLFTEQKRDSSWIYLLDESRGMMVRLAARGGTYSWSTNSGQTWNLLGEVKKLEP